MMKALLVALYLLAMAAFGAGGGYALMTWGSTRANASHTSTKSGPAAYGRLREFGQFRDYTTIRNVECVTVSDTGTTEWFSFTAGDTDIVKLAAAHSAKDSFPVVIVNGRAVLPVHRAPARDGREAWQYSLPVPGGDPATGEIVPPWWQPETLAGSVCYLSRLNTLTYYLFHDVKTSRGYLVVRWG